jgi:hypothetical protein
VFRQAHEDDAERAIRAGLAILEAVDLEVRIAVNTGRRRPIMEAWGWLAMHCLTPDARPA